ncbi:MAG: ribosomal protein S18 acetylase RimI-like enzyme [Cellvibrionaceae bacterium]|jgi:ribosomal protein S18 acetylase RimI-like enzyme
MNISIYEADETNAPRAYELMRMAFERQRRFIEPEPGVFRNDSIGSMSAAVARKEKRLVVALHRKRLLGCILCSPNEENDEDYHFGRLAVNPRYQGNGIGNMLLDDVESWAKSKGYKRVTCNVRKALGQNVAMFESRGYVIYGEGTHEGFDEPTFVKMGKVINE